MKRTKSLCLALDIGVKFGECRAIKNRDKMESAEHLKMEKKWRVLSTLLLEKLESA